MAPRCTGWRQPRSLSLLTALVVGLWCCLLAAPPARGWEFGNKTRGWAEVVSWAPRAILLHGFLTDAEADHMVQLAEPSFERSKVVSRDGSGKLDSVRTSSGTFLRKAADDVVKEIEERVSQVTHLPVSHAENLQILRYEVNQEFKAHWDACIHCRYELNQEYKAHWDVIETDKNVDSTVRRQQGSNPRVATLLMYLSDVEEGGETAFPAGKWINKEVQAQPPYSECGAKGVAVKPRKGDAILFFSLKVNGQKKDAFSFHAGCPVIKGTKYSATSWIHVQPFGQAAQHPQQQAEYGVCRDNNPSCPQWAAAGECTRNPVFMRGTATTRGHCRLSCKVCRVCAEGDVLCKRENERPVGPIPSDKPSA